MPDRLVREGLIASRRWCALKLHLQNLFLRLILAADDYGTFPANPALIRSRCYPLELERAREADLSRWIDELEKAGLVRFHWHRDDRYLTLERFGQAERLKCPRARYPRMAMDGDAPDASGQVVLPFTDLGPPGRPPGYSQSPPVPPFAARAEEKRREEKSPHSPPPAGGGNLPRRFRTADRRAARVESINREIGVIKTEMQDLYHPGGCALRIIPTGVKAARADTLRARWDALEEERDTLSETTEKPPEKTGGAEA